MQSDRQQNQPDPQDIVAEAIELQRVQSAMNQLQVRASQRIDKVVEPLIQQLSGTLHPQLAALAIGKACLLAAASFLGISVNMDMDESRLFNEESLALFYEMHRRKAAEATRIETRKTQPNPENN